MAAKGRYSRGSPTRQRKDGKPWYGGRDEAEISRLYLLGLSTREVGRKLTISSTQVGKIVKSLGISRSRKEAASQTRALLEKPTHWRTCRERARRVWREQVGPIPPKHEIHHIDEDFTNNALANLACVTKAEHAKLHQKDPRPYWQRPHVIAYQREYHKKYRLRKKLNAKA